MKPIKPPQKKLHIEDTESLTCDDCGNYSFIKSYFIRPIEVFSCGNCGKVPEKMMPKGNE